MKAYRMVPHTLHAVKVPDNTKVYNYLEEQEYFTDSSNCIVITGIMGEQYPVTVEELSRSFSYVNGGAISKENLPKRMFEVRAIAGDDALVVFAERFQDTRTAKNRKGIRFLANRDSIYHGEGKGDFQVREVLRDGDVDVCNHLYCINGAIFEALFEPLD